MSIFLFVKYIILNVIRNRCSDVVILYKYYLINRKCVHRHNYPNLDMT